MKKSLIVIIVAAFSFSTFTLSSHAADLTKMNDKLKSSISSNPSIKHSTMKIYNFKEGANKTVRIFDLKASEGVDLIPQDEMAFKLYHKLIQDGQLPIIAIHETNKLFIEALKSKTEGGLEN